jgi:ribosomal protein S18 acetylase RimI-like enzyme
MALFIRSIEITDEPLLWDYLYWALFVPPGHSPFPRDIVQQSSIRRYVEAWGQPNDVGFVAELDGQPIGAVWLRLLIGLNKGYGYWNDTTPELSMAVVQNHRGQGVGSQLLTRLIEKSFGKYSAICLSVDENNPAKRLYDRFDFQVVSKNGSSLTMIRQLAIQ